jgi:membrane protease YdiL (CAAX protease family)
MILSIELLAVLCIGVFPYLLAILFWKQIEKNLDQNQTLQTAIKIIQSLGALSVVTYIALQQQNGLKAVGIDFSRTDELLGGIVAFSFFILLYALGHRLLIRKKPNVDYSRYDVKQMLLSRTPLQRIFHIISLVLAVLAEEIIFRGYFLLLWGNRIDALILCAIISSVLFVILHLYQGKRVIVYHILFATLLATITISTGSIMLAIGTHLYGNLLIQIKLWILQAKGKIAEPSETENL